VAGVRLIIVVAVFAVVSAGCAKVQARTEPVMPELTPPPPPPRVVERYADEPVPTLAPSPAETALNAPSAPVTTKPATPRVEPTAKPEPTRTEPERPAPQPPSLTLKPAPGSQSATEASIRNLLSRATRDLGRVNYGGLSVDGRAQFDTARRFIQQSEDALRDGNLVLAGKLADKAATMGAVLVR
jgi:hypothetical protein